MQKKQELDEKLLKVLNNEQTRQRDMHHFIASENFASDQVRYFVGSKLTNKYAEGYPGKRYYNGCENYDD